MEEIKGPQISKRARTDIGSSKSGMTLVKNPELLELEIAKLRT